MHVIEPACKELGGELGGRDLGSHVKEAWDRHIVTMLEALNG